MRPFALLDHCGTCAAPLHFVWKKAYKPDESHVPEVCWCRNVKCPEHKIKYKPVVISANHLRSAEMIQQ